MATKLLMRKELNLPLIHIRVTPSVSSWASDSYSFRPNHAYVMHCSEKLPPDPELTYPGSLVLPRPCLGLFAPWHRTRDYLAI